MPSYWDQFPDANPDNPQGINTDIANGAPPGSAAPTWAGQPAANAPQYGNTPVDPTPGLNGNPAGNAPAQGQGGQGDPVAFIRQWQATHPASVNGPAEIIAALKANGFNASPFMYGNTPSGNEINLNGEKFKVIGAENSGNPTWYRGENDLPGGGGFSLSGGSNVAPWQAPGILTPYGQELKMPTQAELEADPGYQFDLAQGTQAVQRQAAQRGTLKSGGTLKDLTTFGQGLAADRYNTMFDQNYKLANFNRDSLWGNEKNAFNMLYPVSQLGMGAASQYANNTNDLFTTQGNANARGTVANQQNNNQLFGTLADLGMGIYEGYANRQQQRPRNVVLPPNN